ncbi:hypothetical protein [Desulfosporosinus shakirovi]|uniref:hypothetical protein n=1 Tax=Desulfosporosinus shakirovi TaxID=2885154 RepID=UPI001E618713|nr:hypothetical protein [Desulfosporosinus sp. SRJS8]MCB8818088.1 hypothetical protein [Desulfosporosinus sp. SRJS8]
MKKLFGNIRIDFCRAFFSVSLLLAAVGMCAALFSSISTEVSSLAHGEKLDVLYLFRVAGMQGFSLLSVIFATLPYSTSFCTDWSNQFIRSSVIRTNINSYSISKVFTCAFAGGSAVAIGEILFMLILHMKLPLVDSESHMFANAVSAPIYGSLLSDGNYIVYFAAQIVIVFFASAFFAVLALCISTYLPNVFVTMASPVLFFYFFIRIPQLMGLSTLWFHKALFGTFYPGRPYLSLLYSIFICSLLCVLMGILIVRQIKRRLEHG